MDETGLLRRLAAVVSLDAVGYTALMERDEIATHLAMKAVRREVIDPAVAAENGRIVKYTGDGYLAEFPSALEATMSTIAAQRQMHLRSQGVPKEAVVLRAGVHVGTIIVEPEDIYGDGVNLAARLQAAAEPGGICVSHAVFEQVRPNLDIEFSDRGPLSMRNIAREVRVFSLGREAIAALPVDPFPHDAARPDRRGLARIGSAMAQLSILALPFAHPEHEPDQRFLADAFAQDIVAGLARFRNLLVASAKMSFAYRDHAHDPRRIHRDIGVRYVLRGVMTRLPQSLSVEAELVEADRGTVLWRERFEGPMREVFALQDKITERIVTLVEPRVRASEVTRARRRPLESLSAYDLYLRALHDRRYADLPAARRALELAEKAIALAPNFAPALAFAGLVLVGIRDQGLATITQEERAKAIDYAQRAIQSDPQNAEAIGWALATIGSMGGDLDFALREMKRASVINPWSAEIWGRGAVLALNADDQDLCLEYADRCLALNPDSSLRYLVLYAKGAAAFLREDYDEAHRMAEAAAALDPSWQSAHRLNVAANARRLPGEDARELAKAFLARFPNFRVAAWAARSPFRNPEQTERFVQAFRDAGLE